MAVLIIIPARAGSKGVKQKNIRKIDGKRLYTYAVDLALALKADLVGSEIVVSTDDDLILDELARNRDLIVQSRDPMLADDNTSMIDVLVDIVERQEAVGKNFSTVILLQPTAPLRLKEDVTGALQMYLNSDCSGVASVSRVLDHHPAVMKKMDDQGFLSNFCVPESEGTRRQDYRPFAFMRNGSVYVGSVNNVKAGTLLGDRPKGYEMPIERAPSIDSELDFALVEILLKGRH